MKLLPRHREGQQLKPLIKAAEVLAGEEESLLVETPARQKLLAEWPKWLDLAKRSIPSEAVLSLPDPYGYYMKFVMLVASLAPERLEALSLPESEWGKFKTFFTQQGNKPGGVIDRLDLWLNQAAGARIIFPQHADEISIPEQYTGVREYMHRMIDTRYFSGGDVEQYLLGWKLADPECSDFDMYLQQFLPSIRSRLEGFLMSSSAKAAQVIKLTSALFLLSPSDRDTYGEQVNAFLKDHVDDITLDKAMAHRSMFAGAHIEEPWYSVVTCPEAKLKSGRLVFERDPAVGQTKPLPERSSL